MTPKYEINSATTEELLDKWGRKNIYHIPFPILYNTFKNTNSNWGYKTLITHSIPYSLQNFIILIETIKNQVYLD